jgi:hypothetical protein
MSDSPVRVLAKYLTGNLVAHHSIGLAVGGGPRLRAEAYFALRDAFGINGYPKMKEAEKAILASLPASCRCAPNGKG